MQIATSKSLPFTGSDAHGTSLRYTGNFKNEKKFEILTKGEWGGVLVGHRQ